MIILKDQLKSLAESLISQGLRLIPVGRDKRPVWSLLPKNEKNKGSWDLLTQEPTTLEQVTAWLNFGKTAGLAVVCGSRSNSLYMFDVDVEHFLNKWLDDGPTTFQDKGAPCQLTGGGGYQIAVFVDGMVPGNSKLSYVKDIKEETGRSIAIETRGNGGYAVLPFSLHPSGNYYKPLDMFGGSWASIPTITESELEALELSAKATCEAPYTLQELERKEKAQADITRAKANMTRPKGKFTGESVIDRYNQSTSIIDILEIAGYTSVTSDRMARPSSEKNSPSVEIRHDLNMSIHYSTNDALSDGKAKTPFNVYCYYEHNGNLSEAVKGAAKELGIEQQKRAPVVPDRPPSWFYEDIGFIDNEPVMYDQQIPTEQAYTAIQSVDMLSFEVNDAGNADAFSASHGSIFRHVQEWGWLTYSGSCWERRDAEKRLFNLTKDVLRARIKSALRLDDEDKLKSYLKNCAPTTKNVNACLTQIKNDLALSGNPDYFDSHQFLINVKNGTLDLTTGTLTPHDPALLITHCLNTVYNPNADISLITDFLSGLGLSESVIDYLQQATGYTLTGSTREECLFYIYGPTRSGKGTFVSALRGLLGGTLSSEITFDTLTGGRDNADSQNFALAPLKPCRLVVASESGKYSTLNEAKVKQITGGDSIYCAFKGKDHFNYRPSFKIWLTSNHPPKADVNDDAIWRSRLKLIEFPNSFLGAEDKGLKDKLMNEEAYKEALLLWAIQGAYLWFTSKRGLEAPDEVVEATKKARDQLDYVQQWLDECAEDDIEARVTNAVLYASYEAWCDENGVNAKKKRSFGRDMSKKGYVPKVWKANKKTVRGFIGLLLVS